MISSCAISFKKFLILLLSRKSYSLKFTMWRKCEMISFHSKLCQHSQKKHSSHTKKKIHSFLVVIFFIPAFLLQCCQFFFSFLNFSLKTCKNFCVGDDEFRVHKMRHADDYDDDEITPDNLRLHTSRSC